MSASAGYSGKPLAVKLGIKSGYRVAVINAPENYLSITLGTLPDDVAIMQSLDVDLDLIQFFTSESADLRAQISHLKAQIKQTGGIWISWPKKSSKVLTDLDENIIREIGLDSGLVDVKVAAVDDIWSGLKFVIRLKDRG
ncbi:MAG: DUF3052 domain-containing protein [Anaerolineae bacterium]|nr:DUF3052 domain-containing protein [Anaerolineae bacterium]